MEHDLSVIKGRRPEATNLARGHPAAQWEEVKKKRRVLADLKMVQNEPQMIPK